MTHILDYFPPLIFLILSSLFLFVAFKERKNFGGWFWFGIILSLLYLSDSLFTVYRLIHP